MKVYSVKIPGEKLPRRYEFDGSDDGWCRTQIASDLREFEGIETYEIVGVEEVKS